MSPRAAHGLGGIGAGSWDPAAFGLPAAIAAFAIAAVVVWVAGVRLTHAARQLAHRSGISEAFVGLVVLAIATSLPEIATTVVAARTGNAELAVSNLLGGVSAQVAVLVLADAVVRRSALTAGQFPASVILQGVLLVAMLTLVVLALVVRGPVFGAVSVFTPALFLAYLGAIWLLKRSRATSAWRTSDALAPETAGEPLRMRTWPALLIAIGVASSAILVAGTVLARAAEAIAGATVFGPSFMGFLFLALATSLPEVSTTLTAARLGLFAMAVSNVFGTNLLEVGLLFVADVAYPAGPILLESAATFSLVAAALGILVTCIYLVGLLERRDRTILGLGVDSIAVAFTYVAGVAFLYMVR